MALFATTGVVLGAAYMLVLYRRVVFGAQANKDAAAMPDLNQREIFYFLPLALLVIWLGVMPGVVTDKTGKSVEKLIVQYKAGLRETGAQDVLAIEPAAGDDFPHIDFFRREDHRL